MKRTTIMLTDEVDSRLRLEARRRGTSIADVAREAIERQLPPAGPKRFPSTSMSTSRRRRAGARPTSSARRRSRSAYAAAATRDRHHRVAVDLLASAPRPLLVPALVVTEVAYLLGDRIGPPAELAFARSLEAGELLVEPVLDVECGRIAELTEQYADLPIGIVDASVVALAERRELDAIATFDHRHFGPSNRDTPQPSRSCL